MSVCIIFLADWTNTAPSTHTHTPLSQDGLNVEKEEFKQLYGAFLKEKHGLLALMLFELLSELAIFSWGNLRSRTNKLHTTGTGNGFGHLAISLSFKYS